MNSMHNGHEAKKRFFALLLASLVVSAIIGIVIFIVGDFGLRSEEFGVEARLLVTTLTLAGFSATGLASAALYDRTKYLPLSYAGMAVSLAGFLLIMTGLWGNIGDEDYWKSTASVSIVAFLLAHISIPSLGERRNRPVRYTFYATIVVIFSLAVVLISMISFTLDETVFFRLLGVLAILAVLGSLSVPILRKATLDRTAEAA